MIKVESRWMRVAVVAVAGIALLTGCDMNKNKKPTAAAPAADLTSPTPAPYIPPSSSTPTTMTPAPMVDSSTPSMVTPETSTPTSTGGGGGSKSTGKKATASKSTAMVSGGSIKVGSTYKVKSGDSLSSIAHKAYGKGSLAKHIAAIKKANGLKSDVIRVGQSLKIPAA